MASVIASKGARIASLDGIRGLAIVLVVLSHAGWPVLKFGSVTGVILFFVLSGYLITKILNREHEHTGRIDFKEFYRRRALRLFPALLLLCLVYPVIAFATGVSNADAAQSVGAALFYFQNIGVMFDGWSQADLTHTWSLSTEEQFYLIWPLILLLTLRRFRRAVLLVTAALLIGSLASRTAYGWEDKSSYQMAYYMPWCNAWALLTGSLLALARPRRLPGWLGPVAGMGMLLVAGPMGLLNGMHSGANYGQRLAAGLLASIFAAGLVAAAAHSDSPLRPALEHKALVFFGTISYGLYLWHSTLAGAAERAMRLGGDFGHIAAGTITIPIATAVAFCSYRWVERPFLALKDRNNAESKIPLQRHSLGNESPKLPRPSLNTSTSPPMNPTSDIELPRP